MARRSYDDEEDDIDVGSFMQQQADKRNALMAMALKVMEQGQTNRQTAQDLAFKREANALAQKQFEATQGATRESEERKLGFEREKFGKEQELEGKKLTAQEKAEADKLKQTALGNRMTLIGNLADAKTPLPADVFEGMVSGLSPEDAELMRQSRAGRMRQAVEVAQPMIGAIYEKYRNDPKKLKEALAVAFKNPAQFGGMEVLKGIDFGQFNQELPGAAAPAPNVMEQARTGGGPVMAGARNVGRYAANVFPNILRSLGLDVGTFPYEKISALQGGPPVVGPPPPVAAQQQIPPWMYGVGTSR